MFTKDAVIEIVSYTLGIILSEKIGRRLTISGSLVIASIGNIVSMLVGLFGKNSSKYKYDSKLVQV